jgi:hypothetical protein
MAVLDAVAVGVLAAVAAAVVEAEEEEGGLVELAPASSP